jgi:predicted NBD/HSP70 family sugar kinase
LNILVIDIGGTNVKVWKTGETDKGKIPSGKKLTPELMVKKLKELAGDWKFERVSIGYPCEVRNGHPTGEPWNLADGWIDFDYADAFGCPVRIMNDACMQALGSYEGGRMLYLGLGTSLGCTFITEGTIVPLALGHLLLHGEETFDECLNRKAFEEDGLARWQKRVAEAAAQLKAAFLADYVVLGGGNAKEIEELPEGCRRGGNHNAYFGGLRMWEDAK